LFRFMTELEKMAKEADIPEDLKEKVARKAKYDKLFEID